MARPLLYDQHGVPVPRRIRAAYDASAGSRRITFNARNIGPNSALFESLDKLRDISQDSIRKNPYAAGIVDTHTAGAVGTGIRPRFQHSSKATRDKLKALWRATVPRADFDGLTDFYGLEALAYRAMVSAGEVLGRFRVDPTSASPVPLELELLEADHLPTMQFPGATTREVPDGHTVRFGIELDGRGKRVAYHIYREHPAEYYYNAAKPNELLRIPASEMMHVFIPLRPKQMRGEPWLTRVLVRLQHIDAYDLSELARKNAAAKITGFIKSPAVADADRPLHGKTEDLDTDLGQQNVEIQPGTFMDLNPGEEITLAEVDDVGSMYDVFTMTQLRAVAVGQGLAAYQVSGNVSDVNYTSSRAARLEMIRKAEQAQYLFFIFQFCHRYVVEWLRVAALVGAIDRADYMQNRADYENIRWIAPGWPLVDPLKDVTAAIEAVKWGLTSRANEVAAVGEDIDEIDAENREDLDVRRQLGYGDETAAAQQRRETRSDRMVTEDGDRRKPEKEIVQ